MSDRSFIGTDRDRRALLRADNWSDAVHDLAERWDLAELTAERTLDEMGYSPPPHEPIPDGGQPTHSSDR